MVEKCLERRQFLFRLLLTLEEKRERRSVKYRLFNIERRILPKRQGKVTYNLLRTFTAA